MADLLLAAIACFFIPFTLFICSRYSTLYEWTCSQRTDTREQSRFHFSGPQPFIVNFAAASPQIEIEVPEGSQWCSDGVAIQDAERYFHLCTTPSLLQAIYYGTYPIPVAGTKMRSLMVQLALWFQKRLRSLGKIAAICQDPFDMPHGYQALSYKSTGKIEGERVRGNFVCYSPQGLLIN
ncbi:hypothetical protein GQ53DRAFT_765235 [Thozetella sp. PMI_491]|nr:hypothetical protein GQ53DRAFT_765235 [Thozetella sp. PMI_491]